MFGVPAYADTYRSDLALLSHEPKAAARRGTSGAPPAIPSLPCGHRGIACHCPPALITKKKHHDSYNFAKIGRTRLAAARLHLNSVAPLLAHAGNDRLDTPAFLAPKAAGAMMVDVVRAGDRVIAVGEHGIVLYSDTNGKTWQQAAVPVSVTLTAVYFPHTEKG